MAGLNDDELDAILRMPAPPGRVSMLNPLEIYVPKHWLQRLCRVSLDRMRQHLEASSPTDDQRRTGLIAIQQRVDFLAWLQQHPEDHVYMSTYPSDIDGTEDLEVDPTWFN